MAMVFYVGAGISNDWPSHLPLGGQLKEAVASGFFEIEKSEDLILLKQALSRRTLEEVCGVVQSEMEDKGQLIQAISQALDSDDVIPNQIHRFLARALHDGHVIVTTNYDMLIERAYLGMYGTRFPSSHVCYDVDTFARFLSQSSSSTFERQVCSPGWLLKLHGSFRCDERDVSQSVITTFDRVGRGLPPPAEESLVRVLISCPMVVMGYGCMDIDIVCPVLIQSLSSQPMWWVRHREKLRIRAYKEIQLILTKEEKRQVEIAEVQTLNICRVLTERGKQNGGRVWLIDAPTSQVILLLMDLVGGNFDVTSKPCKIDKGEAPWKETLFQLAKHLSRYERLCTLGKLAQLCAPYKSGNQDIYDVSDSLFQAALGETRESSKEARIYRELGWNAYRRAPEANAEKALELYEKAGNLLPQPSLLDQLVILTLRALALRRARQSADALRAAHTAWNLLPEQIRTGVLPTEPRDVKLLLGSLGLPEKEWGRFGSILRRIAGVYDQCVSGPETLTTSIRCQYRWIMEQQERQVLQRARRLLEFDRCLQHLVGERREKIQSENQLGLVCSKLEDAEAAKEAHQESLNVTQLFGWWYEHAQAVRNMALAQETDHDLGLAISTLGDAAQMFKDQQRINDFNSVTWHIGRIRIKEGDAAGIEGIEKHIPVSRDWHEKANDYALLGIAYYDIVGNAAIGRQHFTKMLNEYPVDDVILKNRAYAVDNALANVISALERLHRDFSSEAGDLREKLISLRQRLERLHLEIVHSLPCIG